MAETELTDKELVAMMLRRGLVDYDGEMSCRMEGVLIELYPTEGRPFSEYTPVGRYDELPFGIGMVNGKVNGEPWHSNGIVALPGNCTIPDTPERSFKVIEGAVNPSAPVVEPVAFWSTCDGRVYLLLSNGSAMDAVYYEFLKGRFPNAVMRQAGIDKQIQYFDDGKLVAVCMPLMMDAEHVVVPDKIAHLAADDKVAA